MRSAEPSNPSKIFLIIEYDVAKDSETSGMIADFADLQRLSGRERPAAVKKWLQSQGISYMLNADGHPVTTEKALNEALLRGRKTEPNWPLRTRK